MAAMQDVAIALDWATTQAHALIMAVAMAAIVTMVRIVDIAWYATCTMSS
ncbi:MAG TPA: hypothetical protein VJ343_01985 [archaeon]|nr:hypothetical protein [archaeon]